MTTSFTFDEFNKRLQNYGCHCFPGNTRIAGGKGAPVDQSDELCRELARCKSCVEMTYPGHDADQGKFKYSINGGAIDCSENTDAKLDQCLCDKHFAEQLGNIWTDAGFNEFYWSNKHNSAATFDRDATCVAGPSGNTQDACCGASPLWRPYSSTAFECCTNGSIASIGSC